MLAKRLKTILPDLTFEEALETTKIYSVAGVLPEKFPLIIKRPFRTPHHTISKIALIGGGRNPKPGEMSLAHNGVLYLDEIAEFDKCTLEVMRVPVEEKSITISRMNSNVTFPSNFIFIASMNPCPCGFLFDKKHDCNYTYSQIMKYKNRLSGPLLDRIDIHLELKPVQYNELKNKSTGESSKDIKLRVERVRKIQLERYKECGIKYNSELTEKLISKFCVLDNDSNKLLESAFEKYNFSARAVGKILKVARTIADIENSPNIKIEHLAEAIQYRVMDKF